MSHAGRCYCGAVRYALSGEPNVVALCHCSDCQRSAGAPAVSWAMFPEEALTVTQGQPKSINGSGGAVRSFCPDCGSGLFYYNAVNLPGIVDVQTATLDDPAALAPKVQIQTADRLDWMRHLDQLPEFERFPE